MLLSIFSPIQGFHSLPQTVPSPLNWLWSLVPGGGPRISVPDCFHFKPRWPRSHFLASTLTSWWPGGTMVPAFSLPISISTGATRYALWCQRHLLLTLAIPVSASSFPVSGHLTFSSFALLGTWGFSWFGPCLPVKPHRHLLILSIHTISPPSSSPALVMLC